MPLIQAGEFIRENEALKPEVKSGAAMILLPSDHTTITESAEEIFRRMAQQRAMFLRGSAFVEIAQGSSGDAALVPITPEGFASRIETTGPLFKRTVTDNNVVLRQKACSTEDAKRLMASRAAQQLLPKIELVTRAAIIAEDGAGVLQEYGRGYHESLSAMVNGPDAETVPLNLAVAALRDLVAEYDFQTPGDRSRALASFITPALKFGGLFTGMVPQDVAEADASQSGKTFRQKCVAAVYGERARVIAKRAGGVGSLDESIGSALFGGTPFIRLDNMRGKLDSQALEAFLTDPKTVPIRLVRRGETICDCSRTTVQMTSNAVETTRDLVNRSSICRIRKKAGHTFRVYPEGNLEDHIRQRQGFYLGAVFAVVREWHRRGKPTKPDNRHAFHEWAALMNYIAVELLGEAPLLDGHQDAQARACSPPLNWVRSVGLAVLEDNQGGEEFSASALFDFGEEHGIVLPGYRGGGVEAGCKVIGVIMRPMFKESDAATIDHVVITRTERLESNGNGLRPTKRYAFTQAPQPPQGGTSS